MKPIFGCLVRNLRERNRLSLRTFAFMAGFDSGNWSRVERGLLPPPHDQKTLDRIAYILDLDERSKERRLLVDYAAVDSGWIPDFILANPKMLKRFLQFLAKLKRY